MEASLKKILRVRGQRNRQTDSGVTRVKLRLVFALPVFRGVWSLDVALIAVIGKKFQPSLAMGGRRSYLQLSSPRLRGRVRVCDGPFFAAPNHANGRLFKTLAPFLLAAFLVNPTALYKLTRDISDTNSENPGSLKDTSVEGHVINVDPTNEIQRSQGALCGGNASTQELLHLRRASITGSSSEFFLSWSSKSKSRRLCGARPTPTKMKGPALAVAAEEPVVELARSGVVGVRARKNCCSFGRASITGSSSGFFLSGSSKSKSRRLCGARPTPTKMKGLACAVVRRHVATVRHSQTEPVAVKNPSSTWRRKIDPGCGSSRHHTFYRLSLTRSAKKILPTYTTAMHKQVLPSATQLPAVSVCPSPSLEQSPDDPTPTAQASGNMGKMPPAHGSRTQAILEWLQEVGGTVKQRSESPPL
ncbi:hypothetical protein GGX14DRAFT_388714 [Mycena pura]|uniref:Uncharacterized protein n=1 Tax=Mycena pura TaxID=153505 RepID=A0AAD6VV28_9AGAR|nr:hypothetical protein GGX14DRAFT_388714 [Mycena pura]